MFTEKPIMASSCKLLKITIIHSEILLLVGQVIVASMMRKGRSEMKTNSTGIPRKNNN